MSHYHPDYNSLCNITKEIVIPCPIINQGFNYQGKGSIVVVVTRIVVNSTCIVVNATYIIVDATTHSESVGKPRNWTAILAFRRGFSIPSIHPLHHTLNLCGTTVALGVVVRVELFVSVLLA